MTQHFIFQTILLLIAALLGNYEVAIGQNNNKSSLAGKASELIQEAEARIESRDSTSIGIAQSAIDEATRVSDRNLKVQAQQVLAKAYTTSHQYENSLKTLRETVKEQSQRPVMDNFPETYRLMGEAFLLSAVYDSAEFYIEKSLKLLKDAGLESGEMYAEVQSLMGQTYRYKGDFARSLEAQYNSLDFFESVADSDAIILCKERIGVVVFLQGELENALKFFGQVMNYREVHQDSIGMGFAYSVMGLTYFRLRNYDQCIEYAWKSVEIRQKLNDVRGLGESYNNLALAYMGKEDWKPALEYLQLSKTALTKGNDLREIPVILGNMGDCYRYLGQPVQAKRYYLEALERAKESGGKHILFNIYRKISTVYSETGDFEQAFEYAREFATVKDSVYNDEKAKAISELELKYEKEKDQQKIAILERDKEIDNNRKIVLGLSLAILALGSVMGFALLSTRNRKNRLLFLREREVLEAREALTEAELRNTRNELSFNKTRLSVYMDNLLKKNSLIEELEARLIEMKIEDESGNAERTQRLNELLELKILTDEDWRSFKQYFEQAFPGFLECLQNAYANLTTAEIRLFLLIRLGLGSREISNMLGVSPDSVKKGRYRLRKKLDLSEEDSLEEFVTQFS